MSESVSRPTVSQRFARFIGATLTESVPEPVAAFAQERILDTLSTAIAASGLPVPSLASQLIGNTAGPATIIGRRTTVPTVDAAFINALLVNGRTQDDFLCKSHPGAVTLPAALAIADEFGGSGKDLIAAIAVGYEVVGRIYLGGPGMLPKFRATGVAGTLAAAATAARMLRLDETQIVNALGCAAVFASGFGAGFLTGTMEVKLNVGMACRNGVTAALLARAGATASPLAFEGEAGFYHAFAGSTEQVDAATEGLGEHYLIEETIYKEFPICIFIQTPVALTLMLASEHRIEPHKIGRITVTVSDLTYTNPGFTNLPPYASSLKARVSARFCIAAALLGRPINEFSFYENYADAEVLALGERIDLVRDPARDDTVKIEIEHGSERLVIEGSEGATLKPDRDKVVAKYRRLVEPVLGANAAAVEQRVLNLPALGDLRELTALLRG
ncbi:2-methylcitrate dehydratase PrpD [Paramixta manurensis]|uniref:2-methylcitrate dehydratase PrpD n=1 Tax=Paramixta manurensis TaxID=2740817 RepID=A0A6M8UF26_9GAMM|nr:2-methylcitrate dehydratase PrpD [Erwiniaceae bacterium PD-1]